VLVNDQAKQASASEVSFHDLIDAITDYAIFRLDAQGRIASWNAGASRVKGYSAEEAIGNHFSIFYPAEDRAKGRPEAILELVRGFGPESPSRRCATNRAKSWALPRSPVT
jgi:PAS domain S-box-containing protein